MNKNYQRLKGLVSFAITNGNPETICQVYAMCVAYNTFGLICDSDFDGLKRQIELTIN